LLDILGTLVTLLVVGGVTGVDLIKNSHPAAPMARSNTPATVAQISSRLR